MNGSEFFFTYRFLQQKTLVIDFQRAARRGVVHRRWETEKKKYFGKKERAAFIMNKSNSQP